MMTTLVDARSLENLEFPRIIACVAERTASGPGRALALAVAPSTDLDLVRRRRGLVREMGHLRSPAASRGGPALPAAFDLGFLDDMEPLFARLERAGVLEGAEILNVTKAIAPALALRRVARGSADRFPALAALVEEHGLGEDSAARGLERIDLEVAAVLDEEGGVKDSASPELRRLRRQARDLRGRLSERAKRLVDEYSDHLQDSFYTLRDDRYVLPVRSDARAGVRGIIHGSSNSGVTLFIEPDVLVDDCNELKVIDGDVLAREREVLASLSRSLCEVAALMRSVHAMLCEVDLLTAIARFAEDAGAAFARIGDDASLDLRAVRHPLLVLAGGQAVPNDVDLRTGRGWVVSGPNAGGKTVLLKTVGLAVLMTYAGLPVTAAEGSVVGAFDHVRAEIGDSQSVEASLSTFSAQVRSLASILDGAGPGSLLLLDELATGTDPDEGAALAEAILAGMVERGAAVLIATHYEPLKKLSISSDTLVAAGMGLDMETLEPTFRLHVGMPGTSGGLLVAERYGLPADLVARARCRLEEGRGPEEGRLRELERLRADLEKRLRDAEVMEQRLASKQVKLEERESRLIETERRRMRTEERYLTTELTVLRSELAHAHKILRRRPVKEKDLERSEGVARQVSGAIGPGGPVTKLAREPLKAEPLGTEPPRIGDRVLVPRLDLEGVVELVDDGRVRIRKGGIAWTVDLADIARPPRKQDARSEKIMEEKRNEDQGDGEEEGSAQTSYNTIDLRGHGLDEAQIDLDAFIDGALEMGIEEVFVIHGHGTGVLKNGLRRYIRHLKKVEGFRPGKRGEGGDGVTVCKLRSD